MNNIKAFSGFFMCIRLDRSLASDEDWLELADFSADDDLGFGLFSEVRPSGNHTIWRLK